MRAIVYTGAGGPEVIAIREVPTPTPGAGEVRVRVQAAGLNRADIYQRRGGYPAPPGWPPDIPGLEYAGDVDAVGPGVTRWRPGDRVMGLVGGGGQAEAVVVRQEEVLPLPSSLSYVEGAAIPEVFYTAYDALVTRGRLAAGERVLIHAVGSGVGTAAAQIAKYLGATVIGTSRSAFEEAVGDPIHLVLDVLGGPALTAHLSVLAPRGRLVMLGLMAGRRGEVDLERLLHKRLEVIGSVLRSRGPEERAALVAEFAKRMLPLFESNGGPATLRPVVERTYPMDRLAEAHAVMERNENFGKLVGRWE